MPISLLTPVDENISQLADAGSNSRGEAGGVEVHLWFDQTDPPAGHLRPVTLPDAPGDGTAGAVEFFGWLGLLRVLSDALADPEDIPPEP